MTTKNVSMGFVKLNQDTKPITDKEYEIITPDDSSMADLLYPTNNDIFCLDIDILNFFIDDLPDFGKSNEGLLKIQLSTRNPQNLDNSPVDATFIAQFSGKDNSYSSSFLYRGAFRNVIFRRCLNIRFDLYELDTDLNVYYDKMKSVISDIPEIKSLDILNGIPYINLATKLFDGIIKVFGKNEDDHVWGEVPILDIDPIPGSAYLRSGIYVIYETKNSKGESIKPSDLKYINGMLKVSKRAPNHLLYNVRINPYSK